LPVVSDPAQPSPSIAPGARPRVGLLGPPGTFAEIALATQPDLAAGQLEWYRTMPDVLWAVAEGEVDIGLVAIENSIEGTVNITSDTLVFDVDLLIQREIVIEVHQHLLGQPGAKLADIDVIASISVAIAQCHQFLKANAPQAALETRDSTADAAEGVAKDGRPGMAAIGNELAAEKFGLEVLARNIEDHPENKTRFVVVEKHEVPPPTGHDKTSIMVAQRADRPGSLLAILQEFAARSINLSKLESRPTKKALGDYCFLLDLEGHVADDVVADCLKAIHTKHGTVKFLGSYPSAAAEAPAARVQADVAAREADAWVAEIRGRIQG
jgi:prephenate dehydratase